MDSLTVSHVTSEIERELNAKEEDLRYAMNRAPSYDEVMPVQEELAFVERVRTDVGDLVAEIEARDEVIEGLKAQLADYHQKHCQLLTFTLDDGDEFECTCESAPPRLDLAEFAPETEVVLVAPAAQS